MNLIPNLNKLLLTRFLFRALLLFIVLNLSQLFFYYSNTDYFTALGFSETLGIIWGNIVYGISTVLMLMIPVIVLELISFPNIEKYVNYITRGLYFFLSILALGANLADSIYFRYTFKRTTGDIFNYLGAGDDYGTLLPLFVRDYWHIFLIWIVVNAAFCVVDIKGIRYLKKRFQPRENISGRLLLSFILFAIWIIGVRGGLQLRPVDQINAGQYVEPKNVALILNTPFTILKTLGVQGLKERKDFTEQELVKIYNPVHTYIPNTSDTTRPNIVIIILESFSKEYSAYLNPTLDKGKYKGYTPFLDSLMSQSLVFTRAYANGKRSIEAIPAILSGIPSMMNEAYITSPYSGNKLESMGSILKKQGYNTSFFHGGTNGTMGFESFVKVAGFDHYYGRKQYNNEKDYDGSWGIWDEPFLQYFAQKMNTFPQPFASSVFTLSSHHPYKVPDEYKGKFRKGTQRIHETVMYADEALRQFFNTAKHMSWYNNTLFIITADHTAQASHRYYQSSTGMYAVPIILFSPKGTYKGINTEIAQHIDILPTVAQLCGYRQPFISFGNNLFDSTVSRVHISYLNDEYQMQKYKFVLKFDGEESLSLFNLETDSLMKRDILSRNPAVQKEMERYLRAYIQQFNNRVIHNHLTY